MLLDGPDGVNRPLGAELLMHILLTHSPHKRRLRELTTQQEGADPSSVSWRVTVAPKLCFHHAMSGECEQLLGSFDNIR